jgi:Na+-transporting NADH:ubiquinone oxidoreductase subunit NqrD
MGLFGATKKRMMVSWGVTIGVFGIVKAVKKLPYPWRSIVDAGVVVGLTYGALSICVQTVRALLGWMPDCDECLVDKKGDKKDDKKE